MSGYQFVRMDTYAMSVPKLRLQREANWRQLGKEFDRKLTVEEICLEAARVPGNHPHIVQPLPPVLIFGMAPEEIPTLLEEKIRARNADIAAEKKAMPRGSRRSGQRAIRKDSPTLISVVGSHPLLVTSDGSGKPSMDDPVQRAAAEKWADRWVKWRLADAACRGATVLSIVAHLDEAHYHLHAFEIVETGRMDARAAHPGFAAKRTVEPLEGEEEKATAARANTAYVAGMVAFQDRHHEEVGAPSGLLRVGPKRRRLTKRQYQHEKKAAEGIARVLVAEEAERELAEAANAKHHAEASEAQACLQRLQSDVTALEIEATAAEAKAEAAQRLHDERVREAELVTARTVDSVIARSERTRQLEEAAAAEEERLRRARELRTSVEQSLDRKRAEAAEQAMRKGAERERLEADLEALKEAAEEQKRLIAAQAAALNTAIEEQDRRETDLAERERALVATTQVQRVRETELDGKLAGLDAFFDGRLLLRDKGDGPRLHIPMVEQALFDKIKPVAAWLTKRLLPIHEARCRTRALAEAAKAWAKGWLIRPTCGPDGELVLKATKSLPPEVKALVVEHHAAVVEMLTPLPDVPAIISMAVKAQLLEPYLAEAHAAQARGLIAEIQKDDGISVQWQWQQHKGPGK
jgi:hypothetical protein